MTKKSVKEVKKASYIAEDSYINSLKIALPPYLKEDDVEMIEAGSFDFEKKLEEKQFKYLLNNAYIKKV
tara:strand:- start:278 stop:484 length:207 start_codon:yes stop_codon:yes gene_type:complete